MSNLPQASTKEQARRIATISMTLIVVCNFIEVVAIGLSLHRWSFGARVAIALMIVFGNLFCSTMFVVRIFSLIRAGNIPAPTPIDRER